MCEKEEGCQSEGRGNKEEGCQSEGRGNKEEGCYVWKKLALLPNFTRRLRRGT